MGNRKYFSLYDCCQGFLGTCGGSGLGQLVVSAQNLTVISYNITFLSMVNQAACKALSQGQNVQTNYTNDDDTNVTDNILSDSNGCSP